ncbi:MAG: histidinol-phosphate transaminase [Pseudonocardiales bacterium]|nr:MAG: histidinol-phosphate transaminase [Pseudonocardiales bacterium]
MRAEPASQHTSLEDLPLRDDLRGRHPYGAPQLDVAVRLNTNENAFPLPAQVTEAIVDAAREVAPELHRYPDRDATALRTDLARYLHRQSGVCFGAERVWAANGSNEILQQLLQAFGGAGRSALGFTPSYSMHPIIAAGTATTWRDGLRDTDFGVSLDRAVRAVREHRPDVVFLCSPNNPTGTALSLDIIAAVADEAPGMVIVDEAYAEFARVGVPSALTLLAGRPRLVVTRTMSKAFGMAGLRLGYLAADAAVVEAMQLVRLPYHLSALTQAGARAALGQADALLRTVEAVKVQRDRIVSQLRRRGLEVADSDGNFALFGEFPDAAAVWSGLLEHGVLVRDVGVPGWLRVSAGTAPEVDSFLAAVDAVLPNAGREHHGGSPGHRLESGNEPDRTHRAHDRGVERQGRDRPRR